MMLGQVPYRQTVRKDERQDGEPIRLQLSRDEPGRFLLESHTPRHRLDDDLPPTDHAEQDVIAGIADDSTGAGGESIVTEYPPQEGMSVEQNPHSKYFSSSGMGASKSGDIHPFPRALP